MMDFVAAFQHWLTLACFVALAVCLFALAVLCAIPELTDAIRRFCGMDNFSKVVCGVCIVGAVLYGGSKGVNVRWDDGLRDNGTLITNDTVAVRWTYSGIPGASSVFIDYREAGSTNKWLNLAETLASAQEWTGTLANATNYEYWVYSTYVPPVPVHTNGVWVGQAYETKARVGAKSFLILNGKVQEHGRTIATPAAKRRDAVPTARDYIQDGLIAMWDGIENAGWGVHDASARTWKNLVGDIDLPLDDYPSQIYFTSNSLYTSNGRLAERQDVETIDGPITYEVCWVRVNKFNQSADTRCNYGQCNLDIFNGQFWHKTSSDGGIMSPVNGRAQESVPFTMSVVGTMGGSWQTLIPYVNATQISGSKYSSSISTQGIRIGSGWNVPISKHHNIRVYSRALSAEEIAHNYKIDKERFNLP